MKPCAKLLLPLLLLAAVLPAHGQAVDGVVSPDDPPPPVTFKGLIPGLDTLAKVREVLGSPEFEAFWYNFKMLYPADGRPGMIDTVHLHGDKPDSRLANIEAASVPEGLENEAKIEAKLGKPEYTLIMHTWKLLDYSEQGIRFTLDSDGNTTGVAYFPHGQRRVPEGERNIVDLRHLAMHPGGKGDLKGLEAAAGEVVISPTDPGWLPYPFKVVQDLKARFVVLRQNDTTVALIGADVFGMGFQDTGLIRREAAKLGIQNTVFGMSHTHSAGDTIGVYGHYPAAFIGHIQEAVVAGLADAMQRLEPVSEVRAAARELPMDGARVMGLIRNARNPAVMDPTVNLVQILGAGGKPIASIAQLTCHPESIEAGVAEIDADYPGYLCAAMKAADMGQPVFLNGALGGMVSGDNPERTHESSKEVGEKLATIMKDLEGEAQPIGGSSLRAETRRLELPLTNENFKPLMESGLRELNQGRIVTDMTYIALGDAQFVSLPGEVLPEVSFEILEQMNGFPRVLIGLGNDQLGYIIPAYDFRDGVYEESMSVGPATAYSVRDMALRMVREKM